MTRKQLPIGLALLLIPALALGWWNEEWASRRQVKVDTAITGADIKETLADFPLLIRLHGGNFGYFAELAENGKDIRFLNKDDKLALKHQVEKVDAFNELGLVWVKLPEVRGDGAAEPFWFYYGNANAPDGSDAKGVYDVSQGLAYHFAEGEALPQDATAYASHAAESKATIEPGGWIGAAAKFTGAGPIVVNPAPQLAVDPGKGWTFSVWIKLDQPQTGASLLEARDGANSLDMVINGLAASARWQGSSKVETAAVNLTPGKWQHLALVARKDKLELYVDGALAGSAGIALGAANPRISIGRGLNGLVDEVQVAATARSADWVKLSYRTQSPDFAVLSFAQDEASGEGGGGHFMVIVQNVTLDGWVVIGLTGIMFVVAVLVMLVKGVVIGRIGKDNKAFLAQYHKLDAAHLSALDQDESEEEKELGESDLLAALVGKHDHFQSSTLYHLYHAGIRELKTFVGDADQRPVPPEAWNLLRVRLDSQVVRESQRLNSNMVLLTIAIAGGPFLGLLGTVMGVMITFATIAATGDVNINSIAPGIAAALLATVAGLAVAIPALFAYNYLLTRIKEIIADMRVFTDEFLALLAMRVAVQQRAVGIEGDGI